ncbi:hypothetical protein L1047_09510 [Synechococcus sp. Nb3U1]|uniref:hypothetical protein n=1 Tax=Synechococcus sp. Nb3U1 TaxID=1914529 RepID=UPI001F439362|nr:hypothetical protein [Synechococcus sp. Nb3U1]MCF2971429.1 hypothetical protein [Synechococcus sp. Nb3U1]
MNDHSRSPSSGQGSWQDYMRRIHRGAAQMGSQVALLLVSTLRGPRGHWGVLALSGLALVGLAVWNWRLGLSLLVGSLVMLGLYALRGRELIRRWQELQAWFRRGDRSLLVAIGSGAAATLGTYTLVSIWAEANQRWLATGAILQGLATLGLLAVLLWEWLNRRQERQRSQLERDLSDIASPDSFKRLVGVRRLQSLMPQLDADQTRLAVDYLRLALDQETVAIVREALLEALQGWGILRRLNDLNEFSRSEAPGDPSLHRNP